MPEGVLSYPRWRGELREGPAVFVVAGEEIRRAWNSTWTRTGLILVAAYTVMYLGSLFTAKQARGDAVHSMDNFLFFLHNIRWGALFLAAMMGGPALLEDRRRGALELYLSRAVTKADYLGGKILAVFGISTLAMVGPALLYFALSFALFEQQPDNWLQAPLGGIVYGLMWGAMVGGLALGISCVARGSLGAALVLLGSFLIVEVVVSLLLAGITNSPLIRIASPFAAMTQQSSWLFGHPGGFAFPEWWGIALWGLLTVLGWALVAWKHPRMAGA
jgi:ABC-type transport system involved in multi-copper enzyme maturation permease subunit